MVFPWMWNDSVTKEVGLADPDEFQFVHLFMILYQAWLQIILDG